LAVLEELSLEVAGGEFLAVVGPTGCGKTTLLNLLAGFYPPGGGEVRRRGATRMVYQQDSLFPWLTVAGNIGLGLTAGDAAHRARHLDELLELTQLQGFAGHYPHQLSGGMRRRVELARVLAGPADALLMDEPFSALDYQTRHRLYQELARMLALRPRTVVLVTHDIQEAALLADRVVVLSARPARVRAELRLDFPRQRDIAHPGVLQAMQRILEALGG
ncbi:MAG: ABC transporter ATP-binding protein, partial [Pseudomonadota bacterium]|nr:ABC transporter ATP-binding protein [Pseudomonadota bacterium]